jgi:predicted nucleic acid-binding protein
MIKAFVDSDVVLHALLRREPFYLPAINLLDLAHGSKIELCISSIAFVNVNYFLRKASLNNRIEHLVRLRSIMPVINVHENIIDLALKFSFTDFEDAVQYYAAVSADADYIITRNIKDYTHSAIPVLTAEQFLQTT